MNLNLEQCVNIMKENKGKNAFKVAKNCDCEDCPFNDKKKDICYLDVDAMLLRASEKLGYCFVDSEEAVYHFDADLCGVFLYLVYKLAMKKQKMEIE